MTPNELYAIPATSISNWYDDYSTVVEDVLQLDPIDPDFVSESKDAVLLQVHDKLYFYEDGERGVSIYALYYDGHPFALMFTGGRGGRDSRTPVVTDMARWQQARDYVLAMINRNVSFDGHVAGPDDEIASGYYIARLARFGDEIRLVSSDDVHRFTGNPVYDNKRFREVFDTDVRALGGRIGYEDGLADPRMMTAGIEAFRAGVIGSFVPLDIDLGGSRIIAASEIDGQTFAHVMNTTGKYFTWAKGSKAHMVGPASLLECYANIAAGQPVTTDCRYVQEAAAAFGADPSVVYTALMDFLNEGGRSIAERIIGAMPRDERVPESLTYGYSSFAAGFMVMDNPDLSRFMSNGYPNAKQAEELVAQATDLDKRIASGELKRPSM